MSADSNPLEVWLASDRGKRAVAHAEHERQQMKQSDRQGKEHDVNVDTGEMGEMAKVLANAKDGERIIPATIIGPGGKDGAGRRGKYTRSGSRMGATVPMVATERQRAPVYGPRKPLREVRRELRDARERDAE